MTRILLPVLVSVVAVLGLATVVPIFLREMFRPYLRRRQSDKWADDLEDGEWR